MCFNFKKEYTCDLPHLKSPVRQPVSASSFNAAKALSDGLAIDWDEVDGLVNGALFALFPLSGSNKLDCWEI